MHNSVPNNFKRASLDEMAKIHEPDISPTKNSNKIINLLSQVQRLLNILSETVDVSDSIDHSLNGTEQYQEIVEGSQVGQIKIGNIYEGLKSLNSTLFTLVHIQKEDYEQANKDTKLFHSQETAIYGFELAINVFAIPIAAFIGCMLSTVGICYLLNGSRRTQIYNMLLSTLFTFDGSILFFMFLRGIGYSMRSILSKYSVSYHLIVSVPIRFFEISSIFMLVSLSHARYSAIRKPFQYCSNLLTWQDRKQIWKNYLIPVIISSLILAAPRLMELEYSDEDKSAISPSSVRLHIVYSTLYVGVLNLVIIEILPIVCLLYLAYYIKLELTRVNEIQDSLGTQRNYKRRNSNLDIETPQRQKHGIKISKSLINGILIFVTLHTFRMVTTFGEFCILLDPNKDNAMLKRGKGIPSWIRVTATLSELCMVIDSSIRVLIHLNSEWDLFPGVFRHLKLWNRKENVRKQDSKAALTAAIEIDDTNYITNHSIQEDETHLPVFDAMNMTNVRRRSSHRRSSLPS